MLLLLYTQRITPRVEYIFSTLLPAMGIGSYTLTADKAVYVSFEGAKINYSPNRIIANELWVTPVSLLSEDGINEQVPECFQFAATKALFKTMEGDFPFDIFAAAFYLITRYEEYLPHRQDMYGRFAHENSIAFKEGFLQIPLVHTWLKHFANTLLQKYPALQLTPAAFRFLPTYDIDIAWSYLHKGIVRNLGGFANSLFKSEWSIISDRLNVLFGGQKDPFYSYQWLDYLHQKHNLKPLYFFLLAEKNKRFDKNILPSKAAMRKLVQRIASNYNVGIHPSWQSGDSHELLASEKKTLQTITGTAIYKSRQHYIRMTLPGTYRRLIEAGITEDYSMGYGSINGFRASWCLPHLWYDLEKEEATSLTVYPFCYMDANSFYEQHFNCEEAFDELQHYYRVTKEVGGLLCTIWHNNFLGTDKKFAGWKEVYERFISNL